MASLCLENTQFLNERTLSESELIMNEFTNINKMIQSICEIAVYNEDDKIGWTINPNWKTDMKTSFKTFTKKFEFKLEELKNKIVEKIRMIIAKIRTSIIDTISKATKNSKKTKIMEDKEEKIEIFKNSFKLFNGYDANTVTRSVIRGLGGAGFQFGREVTNHIYYNMLSNVKNNTRNKTYSSGIEIANDLYDYKAVSNTRKLIKDEDPTTPDEAIKRIVLGEGKEEIKIVYTNSKKGISVNNWINETKKSIDDFGSAVNSLRMSTISGVFDDIRPKNEKEYNEECFKIAIQDICDVMRIMFYMLNAASKYFYELIGSEAKVIMKAAANGYEYVEVSKID